jgi:hypothetical protein
MDEYDRVRLLETIRGLHFKSEWEQLVVETIQHGVKLTVENVVGIWRIADGTIPGVERSILWVEDNLPSAGYRHMLEHAREFEQLGIRHDKLAELAEAATTIGHPGGEQKGGEGPGRPIFVLSFYGKPLAVAITVGSNGFVVGMNRSSLEAFKERTGFSDEDVKRLASWPRHTKEDTGVESGPAEGEPAKGEPAEGEPAAGL